MKPAQIAFLARARATRAKAYTTAQRSHRGQAKATAALRQTTTQMLAAELRRERPRKAGRFTDGRPNDVPSLFSEV